ncbi:MAG: hypothetical protein ACXABG_03210 [Promethearchaeota archaeon]|jgi:hypothetical protein
MEDILPSLKGMLNEAIDITLNASELTITITVKSKVDGIIAEPEEVIVMLKMYGGLREEIHMEINVDNTNQEITITLQSEKDYNVISKIFASIWDNAVDLLYQAIESDFSRIKDIPNIDD